jgi:hypothetical protein
MKSDLMSWNWRVAKINFRKIPIAMCDNDVRASHAVWAYTMLTTECTLRVYFFSNMPTVDTVTKPNIFLNSSMSLDYLILGMRQ